MRERLLRSERRWPATTAGLVLVWYAVLALISPARWYGGDLRHQYVGVFRDIGRRLLHGELPPTIDPDLGPSGNYSLDVQYGTYDPMHWLLDLLLSRIDNLALCGLIMAAGFSVVLATGVTCLTRRLGAPDWWSVAAGLACVMLGFTQFRLAQMWIPGLISLAWVPWLWWALSAPPTRRRLLAVALFTYLAVAGGWPSTWLTVAALGIGTLTEAVCRRRRGDGGGEPLVDVALQASAALAGALIAFVALVPVMQAADATTRSTGVEFGRYLVPDLRDLFNTVFPRSTVSLEGPDQVVEKRSLYFFGWFVPVVACLVPWRTAWRRPGVIAGVVATGLMLALTQLPEDLGPLRTQVRQMAGYQMLAVVTTAGLAGVVREVPRRRRLLALGAVAATAVLAATRDQTFAADLPWGLCVVTATVALVGVFGWRPQVTGVAAVVGTVGVGTLAWCVSVPDDITLDGPRRIEPAPIKITAADRPAYAVLTGTDSDAQRWFRLGVGLDFQRLTATDRMMPGYSSVSSRGWRRRFASTTMGPSGAKALPALFAREPTTGEPWYNLLGLRTIVVDQSWWPRWDTAQRPRWQLVTRAGDLKVYRYHGQRDIIGRATWRSDDVTLRAADVQRASQSYDVTAPSGGLIVFRDVWWPGYHATLDGRPIAVEPLHDTLVSVRIPAGTDGHLLVRWAPLGVRGLLSTVGSGALLLVLTLAAAGRVQRRRRAAERHVPD